MYKYLEKQWHPTKNGDLKLSDFKKSSNYKAWWLCYKKKDCNCPHEWQASIKDRSRTDKPRNCPFCSPTPKKICYHQSLKYKYPDLSKEWNYEKNDIDPSTVTGSSSKFVWWKCNKKTDCKCTHEWQASINDRTRKDGATGCPYCSPSPVKVCFHKSFAYKYPELMIEWDYNKNTVDPNTIPESSDKTVWWICHNSCKHGCKHEFQQKIKDRSRKKGCPFCCYPVRKVCIHNSIVGTHPEIVKMWHPTKNQGLEPSQFSHGSAQKIWWLCPKTCPAGCVHEYEQTILAKTGSGSECPYCCLSPTKLCIHTSLQQTHNEIAIEWHPNKNDLKPSEISYGSDKKVWWRCSKNNEHEWLTKICNRTIHKTGCPSCKNKSEASLYDCLLTYFPEYTIENQKTFDWCRSLKGKRKLLQFDFFIKELNLIIELDGEQHFGEVRNWQSPEENQKMDIYKMKLAIDHGIRVIRITRTLFAKKQDDLEDVLYKHIKKKGPKYLFICADDEYRNHQILLIDALKQK